MRTKWGGFGKETFGTEPDYPWDDWNCVLRHKHNNKWYALVAEISERKLGLSSDRIIDVLNVKCDPLLIGSLRLKPGFFPAYHMNKLHWISVLLPDAPDDVVQFLVNVSFEATKSPKKKLKQPK